MRRRRIELGVLIALSAAVLGWGIWRVAPHQLNGDEWSAVGKALLMVFHEPVTSSFRKGGNFHLRLLGFAFLPLVGYWWATGHLDTMVNGTVGYSSNIPLEPGPVLDGYYQAVLVGRFVSVIAAIGTVYLVYRLTREVANHRAGMVAGVALIAAPGFVTISKFANEDAPQFFLVLLTLYLLVRAVGERRPRTLAVAAVVLGLAVSMKATSGLLLAPFALAVHEVEWRRERSWRHLAESAGLYATLAAIAYFATTPSAILYPSEWLISILSYIGFSVTNAPVTSGTTYDNSVVTAGIHYIRSFGALLAAVGIVAVAAVIVGVARRRYDRRLVLPLSLTLVYAAVMMAPRLPQYPRLVMLQPLVAIAVGVVVADISRTFYRWRPPANYAAGAAGLLMACVVVLTLASTAVFVADFGTSRADASAWMEDHVDPGDAVDSYGYRVYAPEAPAHAVIDRPRLDDPTDLAVRERTIRRVANRCPRFVVLSSYYYGRFLNAPDEFPEVTRLVRRLLANDAPGYDRVAVFGPPPIRDYSDRAKLRRSFNYPPRLLRGSANPTIVIIERTGEPDAACG